MQDLERLGQRLRELREAAGLSRGAAARRAGITTTYWSTTESVKPNTRNNRPVVPLVPALRCMADAVGGDRAELLELAGHDDDAAIDRERAAQLAEQAVPPHWLRQLEMVDPEVYQQVELIALTALRRHGTAEVDQRNPIREMADPAKVERLEAAARKRLADLRKGGEPASESRPAR